MAKNLAILQGILYQRVSQDVLRIASKKKFEKPCFRPTSHNDRNTLQMTTDFKPKPLLYKLLNLSLLIQKFINLMSKNNAVVLETKHF